mmetsp:Transcript_29171/g.21715  ORF Transcript_29171/g.21715 Transcript_29171/m.21715 type:complete len:92 (+) Transcript_29171:205-480(+)
MVEIDFNNVHHVMCIDSSKKYLVLVTPVRFPPSLAVKKEGYLDPRFFKKIDLKQNATVETDYSVEGGGTGREFPINLLDDGEENWNKWYEN